MKPMRIDLHLFIESGSDILSRLDALSKKQDLTNRKLEKIMATLDETLSEVTDEGTRLDSLNTMIEGIEKQLADALAGTTLPTAVQEKVDAVFAGLKANSAKIDTALNSNVPAPAPEPTA
jgi:ABC-type transporter Mla subunit MlaD